MPHTKIGSVIFKPPPPLTRAGRVSRSILTVTLLLGSLFPTIGNTNLVLIAAILSAPVIAYEVLRWLPRAHKILFFVVPLFGVAAVCALLIAPATPYGHTKLLMFLTLTLASAMAACLLRDRQSVITFALTWVVAATVLAVFALAGFTGTGRANVFEANPIWLARAIAIAAVAVTWFWWQHVGKPLLMFLLLVLLIGGLFATGSRGPLLGAIIGVTVLALGARRLRFRRVATVVVIVAGAAIALQSLPLFNDSRLADVLTNNTDGSRQIIWSDTLRVIEAHPFGVGLGNWSVYAEAPQQFLWPHNIFLEVASELGLIVAVLFIAAVIYVFVRLIRASATNPTALLVLAFLACTTFDVNVSGDLNARTFFFLLTLGYLSSTSHQDVQPRQLKSATRHQPTVQSMT